MSFAVTSEFFDVWIHLHRHTSTSAVLSFMDSHGWRRAYVLFHENVELSPHPRLIFASAINYPNDPTPNTMPSDLTWSATKGVQRFDHLLLPHQHRILDCDQLGERAFRRLMIGTTWSPWTQRVILYGVDGHLLAQTHPFWSLAASLQTTLVFSGKKHLESAAAIGPEVSLL